MDTPWVPTCYGTPWSALAESRAMSDSEHPYYYLLDRCNERLAEPNKVRASRANDNDLVFDGMRVGNTLEDVLGIIARANLEAAGRVGLQYLIFDINVQGDN